MSGRHSSMLKVKRSMKLLVGAVLDHFDWAGANTYHRIELDPDVECWTLFMPGIKQRDWGFLVKNQVGAVARILEHAQSQQT
jgi:hypothetical protein